MKPQQSSNATAFVPAEWSEQKCIWTAFPSAADLWLEDLGPAQEEVAAMVRALGETQPVHVLVNGDDAMKAAKELLGDLPNVKLFDAKFGDIWLRDTGPIFKSNGEALRFKNNGWGGKYDLEFDDVVGDFVAENAKANVERHDFILEGGAVDQDGEGTLLTTAQCVLNPNRNPGWTKDIAEAKLCEAFGASKVIWVDEGMTNDHTDGHIDNIVRFVAPGVVACMEAYGEDDPNAEIFEAIQNTLANATDAAGRKLKVVTIPSPGRYENEDGDVVPASHMNFIIGNDIVVMPTYGADSTEEAIAKLQGLFPTRKVVGLSSEAVLTGGGSFHCITQQEPK